MIHGKKVPLTGFSLILLFLVSIAVPHKAEAQATTTLPEYSFPVLTPASQAATAWTNVIPNALASYFTYRPFSNADAVALGFPASCGNLALGTAADLASTEDCYTITVKKFEQQLALPGIFGGGAGLLDASGTPFGVGARTKVYGYGSGGQNWSPPGAPNGVAVTGNAPAPFVEGPFGTTGIWHFPAPTIRGTTGRPVRVQWLNELPNEMPSGFDPTVDCGPNAPDCFPYNRIVTHVHGAHVKDDSDGFALAWFTPNFVVKGPGWVPSTYGPEGTYRYPMDGEAATIWYHDHAMGVTHNNTQMGMAGFFPVTDANEQALIAANILPTGDFELGFALQDRVFDTNGQFAMPDEPVIDRINFPACDPATKTTRLATCSPLFMKAADGHLIPYDAATMVDAAGINADAPLLAASTSLEYFGTMPVVNGVTYGTYAVEARRYRMRFVGGTDSRTWVMKLVRRDTSAVVPFWQIGSEQGFLNNPVPRDAIDLMPGERVDVLVDLTGLPAGTKLALQNIGPDDPYSGPEMLLDPFYQPSVDIPEIMEFAVVAPVGTDAIAAPSAATNLRPVLGAIVPLTPTPGTAVRNVSLVEIEDEYGRTMPTIDSRGFMEDGVPATEIVRLNDVEEWDIINTTVDAHPMHLHLVAFQVVGRRVFDPSSFVPAVTDAANQIFTQASYPSAASSSLTAPEPWEAGWKDTVDCPAGMVTRVRAKFDIPGEKYVYHCHILSHEEHDMMRPLVVRAMPPSYVLWTNSGSGKAALWKIDPSQAAGSPPVIPLAGSANLYNLAGIGAGWEATSYQHAGPNEGYVLWTRGDTGKAAIWKIDPGQAAGTPPVIPITGSAHLYLRAGVGAGWQATSYQYVGPGEGYVLWTRRDAGKAVIWRIDPSQAAGTPPVIPIASTSILYSLDGVGAGWQATSFQYVGPDEGYVLWTRGDTGKAALWRIDPSQGAGSPSVIPVASAFHLYDPAGIGAGWQATSYKHVGPNEGYVLWTRADNGKSALWKIDPSLAAGFPPVVPVSASSFLFSASGIGAGWEASSYTARETLGLPAPTASPAAEKIGIAPQGR